MIVEELKKAILQYAIQGKLTKQLDTDTDINITYNLIQKERTTKFNSKEITKSQYNILKNDENYPMDYPENWKLIQLGYLGYVVGGGTPSTSNKEYWGNEISWITPKDMKNYSTKYIDVGKRSITEIGYKNSSAQFIPKGSVLCSSRAPIGYLGIANNKLTTNQGFKTIIPLGNLNSEYIYYYLLAIVDKLKKSGSGTTFSEISGADFAKRWIVLPPIEEQQRIVDKINELFYLLDELKNTEIGLGALRSKFPDEIKKSILQCAIEGKLTSRLNSDTSVDQQFLNLNFHSNDGLFQIPNKWRWIKFKDLVDYSMGKTPPRKDPRYWGDDYSWISIADMNADGNITNTKEKVSNKAMNDIFRGGISKPGTLIMSFKLTVGKVSILEIEAVHNEAIISIYPKYDENNSIRNYLFKVLPILVKYGDTKGAIKGKTLNSKSIDNLLIPLPPLEEQQRIVEKLDYLLPLIKSL